MSYVYSRTLPVALNAVTLAAARTFTVDMTDMDTLILQVAYTHGAGTALTFAFASTAGTSDSAAAYNKKVVDYGSKTISSGTFTYTTATTEKFEIPFSITGFGPLGDGRVTVTVNGTAVDATDIVTVTPIVARTA